LGLKDQPEKKYMKKISVDNIADEMILAKDICGPSGNVLLNIGTQLSVSLGHRLKNWGIVVVYIESEEEPVPVVNAVIISDEKVEKKLEERFAGTRENPHMKKIFDAIMSRQLGKGGI
jgi:hypothetical protein